MHPAVVYARTVCKTSAPFLKGVAFSTLFMAGGLLASPVALGILCYVGWKTGTDPSFHYSKLMGRSRENVDKIKCNVLHLIESVKRLETELCNPSDDSLSMEVDSSIASCSSENMDRRGVFRYNEDILTASKSTHAHMYQDQTTSESEHLLSQPSLHTDFTKRDNWIPPAESESAKKMM